MKNNPLRIALPYVVGVVVFVSVFVGSEALLNFQSQEKHQQIENRAIVFVSGVRAYADRELNRVLYLSSGLAAYLTVQNGKLNEPEVLGLLAELSKESPHIRNFGIAIGYTLKYVYPEAGNEKAIGLDYRDLPTQWPAVKQAIESRSGLLSGPIKLVQGGAGLIYRKPIYVGGEYWGMLSTVIQLDSFTNAAFGEIQHPLYDFAVRTRNKDAAQLWGDSKLFADPASIRILADEIGEQWEYAVRLKGDSIELKQRWLLHGAAFLIAVCLGLGMLWVLTHRQQLQRDALYDLLTGLPNRRLLLDRLKHALEKAKRGRNSLAVLFLDLNGFKEINDQHGHKVGDQLLVVIGERIRSEMRASDTVSRWGGDEFVVILEGLDLERLDTLVERIRRSINEVIVIDKDKMAVYAAIGVATSAADGVEPEGLLALADQRMYIDKQHLKLHH